MNHKIGYQSIKSVYIHSKRYKILTSFPSFLSNIITRPPRSPIARLSPVLSNPIADMISTANKKGTLECCQTNMRSKVVLQDYNSQILILYLKTTQFHSVAYKEQLIAGKILKSPVDWKVILSACLDWLLKCLEVFISE